jgi:hypothetical protein
LRIHTGGRRALLAAVAALGATTIAPAAANAVSVTVTGDDGNPVALGGPVNIRNMSPQVALTLTAGEHYGFTVTGPNGARVSLGNTCADPTSVPRSVDYVGNGAYAVTLTRYADQNCSTPAGTSTLSFSITASTAIGGLQGPVLTRKPGDVVPNTVTLPIDLNPGALSTDAFVARNVTPNPDGSLPGTPVQIYPDAATKTVPVRLDQGPGTYVVAAHAKGFTGLFNPQAFGPWATPVSIRAFAPFDLQKFTWTDQRGPSYRLAAVIRATGATGRVSVAIGRGKKGKYRSYGTVRIRSHRFSKRFTLRGTGGYRIRFKYKGNATVAPGYEVHSFQIRRTIRFASAAIAG